MSDLTKEQKAEAVADRLLGLGLHSAKIEGVLITAKGVDLRLRATDAFYANHGAGDLLMFKNKTFGYVSDVNTDGWWSVRRESYSEWIADSANVGDYVILFHSATNKEVAPDIANRIVKR